MTSFCKYCWYHFKNDEAIKQYLLPSGITGVSPKFVTCGRLDFRLVGSENLRVQLHIKLRLISRKAVCSIRRRVNIEVYLSCTGHGKLTDYFLSNLGSWFLVVYTK